MVLDIGKQSVVVEQEAVLVVEDLFIWVSVMFVVEGGMLYMGIITPGLIATLFFVQGRVSLEVDHLLDIGPVSQH